MKFCYLGLPLPDGTLDRPRPLLPVEIRGPRRSARSQMLVDSGSDWSLVNAGLLRALGAEPTGEQVTLFGFSGEGGLLGDVFRVEFVFGDGRFRFVSTVVGHPAVQLHIFGHRDFFNRFQVGFEAGRGLFTVQDPVPKSSLRH